MDSVLILGQKSDRLSTFLEKIGYQVQFESIENKNLTSLIENKVLDLTIIDTDINLSTTTELLSFLQNNPYTSATPILVIGDKKISANEQLKKHIDLNAIEFIKDSATPGLVASKVALLLRLRKLNGSEPDAHIHEINAALRDYQEKVTKDLNEAQKIQVNTLPSSIPKSDLFDIHYSYEPLEELGGDWFYVRKEITGEISFLIADVTGHGLAAAFIGVWIKLALQFCSEVSPELRLAEINKILTPQIPDGRFITMSCALYNPKTGVLKHARAGHPPSLLYSERENRVEELLGDGFAVGFFEDVKYSMIERKLDIGDSFTIITDGIIEAQNRNDDMYGTSGVINSVKSTGIEYSSKMIQQQIHNDLEIFTDGRIMKDDVTTIVLKRLG